jgi:ubiquitin carboxyl-terminal hydrolase L3
MSINDSNTAGTAAPKKKHFIPLGTPTRPQTTHKQPQASLNLTSQLPENNPEVMTSLLHTLGLSPHLSFHDVYSISDPDLLAFVPRPAHALLLVFPVSKTYETFRAAEDASKPDYAGSGPAEEVLWYKQTIGNACGLIGLLHGVSNGRAREFVQPGSELDQFIKSAEPLAPRERATLIEESDALERAHQAAAAGGDTAAPGAEDDVDLHYVCFVKSEASGKLWEMDGRRKGPIELGELEEGEDVLSEKALELGVRAFLKREEEAGGGDLRFSLITLAEGLD